MKTFYPLPALPLNKWIRTKQTLHRFVQIVGKIRMELTPFQNHWWHVPLYVTSRGLGTGLISYNDLRFEIDFDFIDHQLRVTSNKTAQKNFNLYDGLTVATFYENLFSILDDLAIEVEILAKPYEIVPVIPFAEDTEHHYYDKKYVEHFHAILLWSNYIFRNFNKNFYGKICPIQLYWHSLDLATTRFSGNMAPDMPQAGRVDREAYSHEVISFGFWTGDDNIPDAAFYSYTFPAPENLNSYALQPTQARWIELHGSPMALLMYQDVQSADNPEEMVLSFLESAYNAGTKSAGWNMHNLQKENKIASESMAK